MPPQIKLRPIETCPNGHHFNTNAHGDTCPVCGAKVDTHSRKTQEELEKELTLKRDDWVCGWLVCTRGVNWGRSYEIKAEKNPIGSAHDMAIRVLGDPDIDKRNHGIIVYEPEDSVTTLLPGDSKGLVYKNGKVIFIPEKLQSLDRIDIGSSQFIYIALCSEQFDWKKEIAAAEAKEANA